MTKNLSIIGFTSTSNIGDKNGVEFREYLNGIDSIRNKFNNLIHSKYGNDLILILFEFYVNPFLQIQNHLKEIGNYRKSEKSIGIPIIINDENFFNKTEQDRYDFLKQIIIQKIDVLAEVVKKKKLDTNMNLLKADLEKLNLLK